MNTVSNSSALIRSNVWSQMLMEALRDDLLPLKLSMDISDFGDGTTYNIPSIGDVVVRDQAEDAPAIYDAMDTGNFTMTITDHKSVANYVTDRLLRSGYKGRMVLEALPRKHLRAIMEHYETRLFAVLNAAHTAANANTINSQSHRLVGSGTSGALSFADLAKVKTSLDKANCPSDSRIMFVDPLAEKDLNLSTNVVNVLNNPRFEGIITQGFAKNMRFLHNIYGIDVYESNRLPDIASETIGGSTVTSGKAAIALCVSDPDTMSLASAWRRMPETKGEYNKDFDREEFVTYCSFGFGVKREESMAIVIHNVTNV